MAVSYPAVALNGLLGGVTLPATPFPAHENVNGAPAQPQEPVIPPLKPVDSTHLAAAAHDQATKMLFVQFHDASVYGYQGVPEGAYQAMITHEHPGVFFNARIKGQFRSAKLKAAPPKPKAPLS